MRLLGNQITQAEQPEAIAVSAPARASLVTIITRLTRVNLAFIGLSLLTGPLLARGLGPTGRGELAAVVVPLSLAPFVLGVGLPVFAVRAAARQVPLGLLIGSLGLVTLAVGGVVAVLSQPISTLLAGHQSEKVREFIQVALILSPVTIFGGVLSAVANGLERYRLFSVVRLATPLLVFLGTLVAFALGALTFRVAAIIVVVSNTVPLLLLVTLLRRAAPIRFAGGLAKNALSFGFPAWLGGLANLSNLRLDQLMMIPFVSARQLGFYAVSVNVTALSTALSGAANVGITPRVAAGDHAIISQATRLTVLTVAAITLSAALIMPIVLPLIFGSGFADAVPIALVLLLAAIPQQLVVVLGAAMSAAGRPGGPAQAEFLGLLVTAPGLLVLLPLLGAMGAALVSLAAYSVTCVRLLVLCSKRFGYPISQLVRPGRDDADWLARRVADHFSRAAVAGRASVRRAQAFLRRTTKESA